MSTGIKVDGSKMAQEGLEKNSKDFTLERVDEEK
jgi:hypothetical protein